jgi:hypothetical protein
MIGAIAGILSIDYLDDQLRSVVDEFYGQFNAM